MADRYWVGGTDTWDGTVGTKWSATSGGAGGASVPTSADDVYFDANSGSGTVTLASGSRPCRSFNATGFTGTLAGTGTPSLDVYGNLTFGSGMTVSNTLTTVNFLGTGSWTITTNGKSLVNVTFNNAAETWTLQDALTATGTVTLTAGIIDLGSYTLTCAAVSSSNSTARSIAFGTGKIVLTGTGVVWNFATSTAFTSTGTDKTVEVTLSAAQTITPGTPTEANAVDFVILNTAGNFTLTLTGADNYRNLTFGNATYTVANTAITIYGNVIIEGASPTFTAGANTWTFAATGSVVQTLTTSGKTLDFPITKGGGTTSTLQLEDALTVAGTRLVSLSHGILDLQSHTLTTGNFTASFSTARTIAFGTGKISLSGAVSASFNAATITNLSMTGTRLVEIIVPGSGVTSTAGTGAIAEAIAINVAVVAGGSGSVSITGPVNNLTFANAAYTVVNNANTIYGDVFIAGPLPTFAAGANTWTFAATGSVVQNLTTNGETLDFPITKGGSTTSTLRLQDALSVGFTRTVTLTSGILDLQSHTLTLGIFSSSNANVRSIAFGTGKIFVAGTATATAWSVSSSTNFTSSGSKLVEVTAPIGGATKTLGFGTVTEANTLDVSVVAGGSTGTVTFTGNVRNLTFADATYTVGNGAVSIFGNFLISGTSPTFSAGTGAYSFVATSGVQTITTNGETLDFPITVGTTNSTVQLEDALTLGTGRAFTFSAGTLNLQSYTLSAGTFASSTSAARTLNFGTGKIVLTGSGTLTLLNMGTSTSFVSTGTRLIEALTGASGTRTLSFGTGVTEANTLNLSIILGGTTGGTFLVTGRINNFSVDNVACAMDLAFGPFVYGDFFIGGTSVGWNGGGTATTTFAATSGTKNITTNGVAMECDVIFNGVGGAWQLQSALTVGTAFRTTLTAGSLNLNGYSYSTGSYTLSTSGNVKSLDFGTSEILITDSRGYSINFNVCLNITTTSYTNYTVSGLNRFALGPGASDIFLNVNGSFEDLVPSLRVLTGNTVLIGALVIKDLVLYGSGQIRPNTQSPVLIDIYGNLLVEATWTGEFAATGDATFNPPFYYNRLRFLSTTGVKTITSNGKTVNAPIIFESATGSWRFEDAFQQSAQNDPGNFERYMELSQGAIDFNGYTVTVNSFRKISSSVTTMTFNGGILSIIGTDYTFTPAGSSYGACYVITDGLTINRDTGEIRFLSSGRTTFLGGGSGAWGDVIFPPLRSNGTNGLLIRITSSKLTLADLLPHASQNSYFYFNSGVTIHFDKFTLAPTSPRRAYLISNTGPGSPYYFVLNSGIANCQRLNIEDSQVSPATNTWYAGSTSVNVSGNTGWIFADAPVQASSSMLLMFM